MARKNETPKALITLSREFFATQNLLVSHVTKENRFSRRISLYTRDNKSNRPFFPIGQIKIFYTSEEAQYELLTSQMTQSGATWIRAEKKLNIGNVALILDSTRIKGESYLYFVRNNVLVQLHGGKDVILTLARNLDSIIQQAPSTSDAFNIPSFVITKDVVSEFSLEKSH